MQNPESSNILSATFRLPVLGVEVDRVEFSAGARDLGTTWIATASWGLVTGVAMVQSGMSIGMATLMSLLVYAGSAQLAAIPLLAIGAPLWLICLTALVVNVRFIIFGAAMAPYLRNLPLLPRLFGGYISGDTNFALFMERVKLAEKLDFSKPTQHHGYHFGMTLSNYALWHVASLIGIALSQWIPLRWGLGFAAVLALTALLASLCKDKIAATTLTVSIVCATLTAHWPLKLGLLFTVLVGVACAMWMMKAQVKHV